MIAVPPGVQILLATRPVDFRKGMDGLAALVQQALLPLGAAPFHYLATGASASFGPYPAPVGLTFDVLCIDSLNVASGSLGCLSAVSRYTVN